MSDQINNLLVVFHAPEGSAAVVNTKQNIFRLNRFAANLTPLLSDKFPAKVEYIDIEDSTSDEEAFDVSTMAIMLDINMRALCSSKPVQSSFHLNLDSELEPSAVEDQIKAFLTIDTNGGGIILVVGSAYAKRLSEYFSQTIPIWEGAISLAPGEGLALYYYYNTGLKITGAKLL